MAQHNLKQMLELGLQVMVNSDDPAYFGGYVGENFVAIQEGLSFTPEQLVALAENSFRASFLSDVVKEKYLAHLHQWVIDNPYPS
jgi:adenosine deaminase